MTIFLGLLLSLFGKKNIVSEPQEVFLDEKECIGYSISTSLEGKKTKVDIPPFYHEVYDNNKLDKLRPEGGELKMHCIFDFHENQMDLDYFVAVENELSLDGDEYSKITLPQGKYIKFEVLKKSQKAVMIAVAYVERKWLKKHGYTRRMDAPPFILYDERFHSNYKEHGWDGPDYFGYPLATFYIPVND